jgi:hypothetical protein
VLSGGSAAQLQQSNRVVGTALVNLPVLCTHYAAKAGADAVRYGLQGLIIIIITMPPRRLL